MNTYDVLITNCTVVDGSGRASFRADVAVRDERIVEITPLPSRERIPEAAARQVLCGETLLLVPGFVDVHGHSDLNILACPMAESKLRQGITTEIFGNCGESAFPLFGAFRKCVEEDMKRLGLEPLWRGAEDYFKYIEALRPAVNVATYVGHGSIRAAVLGFDDRSPSGNELDQMKREVRRAMDAGAIGLSTGLIYPPGIFATTDEIIELQRVASEKGGIYSSHVRGEGDLLLQAADEFLQIALHTGSQAQFSHLKASGRRNWGKVLHVLSAIEDAANNGLNVWFDKYPYIASSTSLASLLPRWVLAGGSEQTLSLLADSQQKAHIIEEAEYANEGCDGWDSVLIVDPACDEFAECAGRSIGQIARELGRAGGDVFIDLLIASKLRTSICNFTMNWEETDMVLQHPRGFVCTDGACRAPYGPLSYGAPHPRVYGTFGAYFRRYVKELKSLTLEEAIRKVTSLPCQIFGFRNRGEIRVGYYADMLLLDWEKFRDQADFTLPHQYCTGIEMVMVNGVVTLLRGSSTGQRGGRVLRRETPLA